MDLWKSLSVCLQFQTLSRYLFYLNTKMYVCQKFDYENWLKIGWNVSKLWVRTKCVLFESQCSLTKLQSRCLWTDCGCQENAALYINIKINDYPSNRRTDITLRCRNHNRWSIADRWAAFSLIGHLLLFLADRNKIARYNVIDVRRQWRERVQIQPQNIVIQLQKETKNWSHAML